MRRRRTGLGFACFAPQNRQKREGSRGFVRNLRFGWCVWGFREKLTHRRPELIKFPMPVARHENKKNPAMHMTPPGGGVGSRLGGDLHGRNRGFSFVSLI